MKSLVFKALMMFPLSLSSASVVKVVITERDGTNVYVVNGMVNSATYGNNNLVITMTTEKIFKNGFDPI